MRLVHVTVPAAALAALLGTVPLEAAEAPRPNIVLIMADDMGFSDIGCYGGEIETPNLDGLAAGGLRFTQFYNTARCCPTRACLLTGLYPHQAGVGHMMDDTGGDGYRGDLNDRCVTIAEVLRTRRLRHLHGRQVARHARTTDPTARSTTGRGSAASTASTARSRGRQLLRPAAR